ncbi:hypothetical protein MBH78_20850 [Oceanimonas sp. NS1]|nr:hypothetical protein [Oceanimonas sp. NS1]
MPAGPLWGRLHRGEVITLDDGRIIKGRNYQLAPATPRKVVIGGDNDTPALLNEAVKGASVLVHEATYTREVAARVGPEPQHSSAAAVAAFAAKAGCPIWCSPISAPLPARRPRPDGGGSGAGSPGPLCRAAVYGRRSGPVSAERGRGVGAEYRACRAHTLRPAKASSTGVSNRWLQ